MNRILLVLLIVMTSFLWADSYKVINVSSNDTLNIREKGKFKSKKVSEIPYNANCIKKIFDLNGWSLIRYKKDIGWVKNKFIKKSIKTCTNSRLKDEKKTCYF